MKKTITSTDHDGRITTHTVTGVEVTPAEMKPHIEAAFKAGWQTGFIACFDTLTPALAGLDHPIKLVRMPRSAAPR